MGLSTYATILQVSIVCNAMAFCSDTAGVAQSTPVVKRVRDRF